MGVTIQWLSIVKAGYQELSMFEVYYLMAFIIFNLFIEVDSQTDFVDKYRVLQNRGVCFKCS